MKKENDKVITNEQFDAFIILLKEKLYNELGENIEIDIYNNYKNNGVVYRSLSLVMDNNNISPSIPMDHYCKAYYYEGMPMEVVVKEVADTLREVKEHDLDANVVIDYELVKEQIHFRVINYEMNRTQLVDMPHIKYLDLAITFYVEKNIPWLSDYKGCISVNKKILQIWNISEEELYQVAMKNTMEQLPAVNNSMKDVIRVLVGINYDYESTNCFDVSVDKPMKVLTNKDNFYGAAVLYYPNVLKEAAKEFGEDLIILPSSVHEIIIVPASVKNSFVEMNEMIKEINEEHVDDVEVLSDHLYYYDFERDEIRIPRFK